LGWKRKVKILFADQSTSMGGAERSLYDIIKFFVKKNKFDVYFMGIEGSELANKVREDFGISVFTLKNTKFWRIKRWDFYLNPFNFFFFIKTLREFRKKISFLKPDIIYTNTVKFHLLSLFARCSKWIIHMRDILTQDNFLLKILVKFFENRSDKIICISKSVQKQFKNRGKAILVYNGIDRPKNFENSELQIAQIKRQLRLKDESFVVSNIGQIAKWKGQEYFVKIARCLRKKSDSFEFLLVGDAIFSKENGYKEKILNMAKNLKNFHYLGWRDPWQILLISDIVIHTPVKPEPFGRVILESFISGKPVLAFKNGATEELIKDGYNGYLFEVGDYKGMADKILEIFKDADLYKYLSKNALETAKKFSLKKMLNNVGKIVYEVI